MKSLRWGNYWFLPLPKTHTSDPGRSIKLPHIHVSTTVLENFLHNRLPVFFFQAVVVP
jgi:hypothetical protein